jgi:hypothetical protein
MAPATDRKAYSDREPPSDRKLEASFGNRGPHVGRPSLVISSYRLLMFGEAPVCLLLFR